MTTRILRYTLTAVLFVAVFGVALREALLARKATDSLAYAINKEIDIEAAIRIKERLLSEMSERKAALKTKLEELQSIKERLSSYEDDLKILAVVAKPWREIALYKDSKLQAQYLVAERAAIPLRYAAFVSAQGLPQDVAQKLEADVLGAEERTLDIRATAQAQGFSEGDPAIVTLQAESDQELQAAITDLLGSDGHSQIQQYERTLPTRSFVDNFAGELAFTDSPLTAQQSNQLVSELLAANGSYQNGGPAVSPLLVNYNQIMATQSQAQEPVAWDTIKSQVQSILTDSQFALLDSMMQNNETTIQLYNLMKSTSESPMLGFSYWVKAH